MNRTRIASLSIAQLVLLTALAGCKPAPEGGEAATVNITHPTSDQVVSNARFRVEGEATDADTVTVQGEETEVVGGKWEVLLSFDEGENTVTASAGDASHSVDFLVDSVPPKLEVTAPERASWHELSAGDTVVVRGTVTDGGTGLETFKVGEQIVRPADDGSFEQEVLLEPGLNEITVTATDFALNTSEDIRGVMHGEWTDPVEEVDPGFNIYIESETTEVVEQVIEDVATPERVTQMMQDSFSNDNVTIDSIEFDPLDVDITLARAEIRMSVTVTNASFQGTFTLVDTEIPTTVEVATVTVNVVGRPSVTPEGGLNLAFENAVLELDQNDVSYNVGDLSDDDSDFLEGLVVDTVHAAFGSLMSDRVFDLLYDPDILKRKIDLLGREFVFELKFRGIEVFSDGIVIDTTFVLPSDRYPDVPDAPGALSRLPGPSQAPEVDSPITFTTTRNAIDRVLHGVWRTGLVTHRLNAVAFAALELPFDLTAEALATLLDPRITQLAEPRTPAEIRLRPQFPPVAEFDASEGKLEIHVGELWVDFLLAPPAGEDVVIGTTSFFLDLSATISIDGVAVHIEFETDLRADLIDEPELDLDDAETEELFEGVVALIPELVAQELDLVGEADITWVKLTNPQIAVHGSDQDWATVGLEVQPNPEGVDIP